MATVRLAVATVRVWVAGLARAGLVWAAQLLLVGVTVLGLLVALVVVWLAGTMGEVAAAAAAAAAGAVAVAVATVEA